MIEREFKLAAEAGILLPQLTDSVAGVVEGPKTTLQLDAVYYDTPTLALARWGVTLRSRSGEPGPIWTLKLPVSSADSELSRHEFMFDEPAGPVPLAGRRATKALTRSQILGPVVRLQTERTEFVVELDGHPIAKLCDDTVVADGASEPVTVFREIELELIDSDSPPGAAAAAVSAILSRLRDAGCKDDETPVPKMIRALGPRAFDPPDVVIPKVGKHATVGALVRNTLARSATQLVCQHAKVVVADNPEDLHQFRVASRRLRSDLRTFAPLLDPHLTKWLRDELGWLAREVGIGRDADVLAERLRSQLARLPDRDVKPVDTLLKHLAMTTDNASDHVLEILTDDRYVALLEALIETARQPHYATEPTGLEDRAARSVLVGLAHRQWRRLRRAVDDLAADAPDAAFHAIRIRAKRARYAADAVVPLFGKDARRFARALADVQTVLGEYQDTTVAEAWLRSAAKALPSTRLVAGELIAFERDDRVRLRADFWKAWKKASPRELRKWLN